MRVNPRSELKKECDDKPSQISINTEIIVHVLEDIDKNSVVKGNNEIKTIQE